MRTFLRIPLPQADDVADLTMRDGAVVRLRQHGRKGGVRLVVSHGNGLASNGYAPFWMPLTERFEVIAFDVRNHGENPLHDPALHTWESFLQDFEQIFQGMQEWLGPAPTIGAFHSLSAIIALNHTLTYGPRWDALALFDPPIYPRDGHPLQRVEHAYTQQMALRASKRPQMYESPELLASQLAMRPTFRRWVPGSHLLLARSTLRQTDQGTWILCNPRDLEAVYDHVGLAGAAQPPSGSQPRDQPPGTTSSILIKRRSKKEIARTKRLLLRSSVLTTLKSDKFPDLAYANAYRLNRHVT
jgi:pimeloyl-ACP methyl ester carboxylesterase